MYLFSKEIWLHVYSVWVFRLPFSSGVCSNHGSSIFWCDITVPCWCFWEMLCLLHQLFIASFLISSCYLYFVAVWGVRGVRDSKVSLLYSVNMYSFMMLNCTVTFNIGFNCMRLSHWWWMNKFYFFLIQAACKLFGRNVLCCRTTRWQQYNVISLRLWSGSLLIICIICLSLVYICLLDEWVRHHPVFVWFESRKLNWQRDSTF